MEKDTAKPLRQVIRIDDGEICGHLDERPHDSLGKFAKAKKLWF